MKRLTTNDVAQMADVNQDTVERWVRKGKLDAELIERPVREGGEQYIFKEKDVRDFLKIKFHEYLDMATFYQNKANAIRKSLDL